MLPHRAMYGLQRHFGILSFGKSSRKILNERNIFVQNLFSRQISSQQTLEDLHGRQHTYLRISLTERCNLRCQYCMPTEGVKLTCADKLLNDEEILYLSQLFASVGITKIRFTGGEPTIRKQLPYLIERTKLLNGIETVALTSNGIVLTKMLPALQRAGLDMLNVSLDTLKPDRYEFMTRRKGWERVMAAIDTALQLKISPLKINCVVMKGFNDDELVPFVEMTRNKSVQVRFIEYMPFGGNRWEVAKMMPYSEMLKVIQRDFPNIRPAPTAPNETAKVWSIDGHEGQVGFITSMTQHFCHSCNRLRITADGNLKVCLFGKEEVSLRDVLRSKPFNELHLIDTITSAVRSKKKQHAGMPNVSRMANRPMILIDDTVGRLSIHPRQHIFSSRSPNRSTTLMRSMCTLNHCDALGNARMVDVSHKPNTVRIAEAECTVRINAQIVELIKSDQIKKGNVLNVAQIAGIMATKRTHHLIPLCHNIPLTGVRLLVELDENENIIVLRSYVKTVDSKTGVEMEALTAVSVAALTVYDMCKAISHAIHIENIHLVSKCGGKSSYRKGDKEHFSMRDYDRSPLLGVEKVHVDSM